MIKIKNFKQYNNTLEDKVINFNDFEFKKYNSNVLLHDIMLWLRNFKQDEIKIDLDDFLNQTHIDRNKFLTFVNDLQKDKSHLTLDIERNGDTIIFKNLYKKPEPVLPFENKK